MSWPYNTNFPGIDDLRKKAMKQMPKFAFEYLDGGCNEDVNLFNNTAELRKVELQPKYLKNFSASSLQTTLFGHTYDAPFGIAPVGLQGLIWPNSPEILAKAAYAHNIPFVLSTVSTSPIERIMELTQGRAWYQLYHPAEDTIKKDIINRAEVAGCKVLVILCDVPSFGYRPRDIRNGLAMPPKMSLRNILQIMGKPEWALKTLIHGTPSFETMKPYMPKGLNMKQLGLYMNRTFSGRLNEDRIAAIRDQWKGHLVLKGVATAEDTATAIKLGLDGVIVSNHGGRQLDAGQSTIAPLIKIVEQYKTQIKVMMDSGIRSGADVARCLAAGADFTFLGRTFMYGVGALGNQGGDHTIAILKTQLKQVMDQIGCENVSDFEEYLAR
jgi:L-lactate dehydrogenase (cytochrome)